MEATTATEPRAGAADWRLGFASMEEETAVERLPVTGALPDWLAGALVRVTPAKLDVGGRRVRHWFDGLAMLNRFGFGDDGVSYASRFLDTRAYRGARDGKLVGRGFATDPCRTLFSRVQSIFSPGLSDNANVNLARLGERYVATTETPLPVEFDPETLATVGPFEYADRPSPHATTAHPHHDPERGELVNYYARFSRASEYVIYGMPLGDTRRRTIARMPVKRPSYMHSFALGARHVVLAEHPLRVNPLRLLLSGRPFIENYRWDGDEPSLFHVFDRASGERVGSYEAEPFFCFHHVNAFERDGALHVDLIAYEDASIIDALYLDDEATVGPVAGGELRRYALDLGARAGDTRGEALAAGGRIELPRIDYGRHNGSEYRYAYANGIGADGDWLDMLVKLDVGDRTRRTWRAEGCYPGEPVFIRRPGGEAEDDGVVLSVVLDTHSERSFLLVLDAGSFDELARAEAPHRIPFGFHGQHFR